MRGALVLVVLIVCGVTEAAAQTGAPAEATAPPAATEPIKYSWQDGETTFTWRGGEAVLSNRAQFRWLDRRRPARQGVRVLAIPRARSEVTGWLGSERLTYEVQMDWADGPELQDLSLSLDLTGTGAANVRVGQFKAPFGRQRLTSSGSQQFVDRSDVIDEFTEGRDIGVQVHGLLASERVAYQVALFNGAGQNTWSHDGGPQVNARVMVQPFGEVDYSESDVASADTPLLALAANVETSDRRDDDDAADARREVVVGGDVAFHYRGLSLSSEAFVRSQRRIAHRVRDSGVVIQGGYFVVPHHLEIAGRLGRINNGDAAADAHRELGVVVGYFAHGHNLKVQADVRRLSRADERATHEMRVQVQVAF